MSAWGGLSREVEVKLQLLSLFFEYIFRSLNINLLSHFSNRYWVLSAIRINPSICIFFVASKAAWSQWNPWRRKHKDHKTLQRAEGPERWPPPLSRTEKGFVWFLNRKFEYLLISCTSTRSVILIADRDRCSSDPPSHWNAAVKPYVSQMLLSFCFFFWRCTNE